MKRAFTLIELIIYMGLVSAFMVILFNMFTTTLESGTNAQAVASVDQDAQFILSRIAYDIHRASDIITPATIGQTTNSLSLKIGANIYTYSLTGQKLQLTDPSGTVNLNSYDTLTPTFTATRIGYIGSTPSAQITLSLQSITVSRTQVPETRTLTTTYILR